MGAEAANPAGEKFGGLERLLRLLFLFEAPGVMVTASEIAERCGYADIHGEQSTGRKNFNNDRGRAELLGVRIHKVDPADPGDDRWVADADQRFPVALEDVELAALVATGVLRDGTAQTGTRNGSRAGNRAGSRNGAGTTRADVPETVAALQMAVRNQHLVCFTYHRSARALLPGRVFSEGPVWYFEGEEPDTGTLKKFVVERFEGPVTVDPSVRGRARSQGGEAHPCHWPSHEPIEVVVRFDGQPSEEWCNTLGLTAGHAVVDDPDADGSVRVRGIITNRSVFADRMIVVGPVATIESPDSLRDELHALVRAHLDAWSA